MLRAYICFQAVSATLTVNTAVILNAGTAVVSLAAVAVAMTTIVVITAVTTAPAAVTVVIIAAIAGEGWWQPDPSWVRNTLTVFTPTETASRRVWRGRGRINNFVKKMSVLNSKEDIFLRRKVQRSHDNARFIKNLIDIASNTWYSCGVIIFRKKIIYPSKILVLSDVRPSNNLIFCNV